MMPLWVKLEDVEDALVAPVGNAEVVKMLAAGAVSAPVGGVHQDERLRVAAMRASYAWRNLHGVQGVPTEEPDAEAEYLEAMEMLQVVLVESEPPKGRRPSGRCSECSAPFEWRSGKGLPWSIRIGADIVPCAIAEDIYLWRCVGCDNHMMDRKKVEEVEAAAHAWHLERSAP